MTSLKSGRLATEKATLWIVATADLAAALTEVRRHIKPEWETKADGTAAPGEVERLGLAPGQACPYPPPSPPR